MIHQVNLNQHSGTTLAIADNIGVTIIVGWTVLISKESAIRYVKTYNESPNDGFYEHDGNVILTTANCAKISLSMQEAQAVIDLIRAAYKV